MTEKIVNLFLYINDEIIREIGAQWHDHAGTDEEKMSFLQSRVNPSIRTQGSAGDRIRRIHPTWNDRKANGTLGASSFLPLRFLPARTAHSYYVRRRWNHQD